MPEPIDLGRTTRPDTTAPPADDPNAAEKERMNMLAEQQCLDDPSLETGVVRLVDPASDQVLAEVTTDCSDVRSR